VWIKILGSAAGGGFPQWNCGCVLCRGVRERKLNTSTRTQCQVAISSGGEGWFLLNASPDLRAQIEATRELHPSAVRQSPIAGVVVTGGDLDQVLGLLLLRELQPIRIYATASVRRLLRNHNTFFKMLSREPGQSLWTDITPGVAFALASPAGSNSALVCRPMALQGGFPAYVGERRASTLLAGQAVLGLVIESNHGGGRLAYFPVVADLDANLITVLNSCDLLLFDGTFWTEDELIRIQGGGRTARQMGHLPISGPGGSLERLSQLQRPRKIFVHINNTNPILDQNSPEYQEVRNAGWEVAEDGWEFKL
jgi:pyrroloquinoline quinone biosynthesis protein B